MPFDNLVLTRYLVSFHWVDLILESNRSLRECHSVRFWPIDLVWYLQLWDYYLLIHLDPRLARVNPYLFSLWTRYEHFYLYSISAQSTKYICSHSKPVNIVLPNWYILPFFRSIFSELHLNPFKLFKWCFQQYKSTRNSDLSSECIWIHVSWFKSPQHCEDFYSSEYHLL